MILMIDNYDSFTYNLVQYLGEMGEELVVYRNDRVSVDELERMNPDAVVISPGPRTPQEAGISIETIERFAGKKPILGVCLGHQSIGETFGAEIVRAKRLMHGKTSLISHDGLGVFEGVPNPFTAIRYHSLAISRNTLPKCLTITAESEDGEIMGIRHKYLQVEGVQFHPESILTEHGKLLLSNFVKSASKPPVSGVIPSGSEQK